MPSQAARCDVMNVIAATMLPTVNRAEPNPKPEEKPNPTEPKPKPNRTEAQQTDVQFSPLFWTN